MRVFVSGIMQGSRVDDRVSNQQYREVITRILCDNVQSVEIIDPWAQHPDSEGYDIEQARETFMRMNALAGEVDVLVAFLPEASMGTAIEMWQAYHSGALIFTISRMADNWVVKLLSSQVFSSLEAFEAFVVNGGLTSH